MRKLLLLSVLVLLFSGRVTQATDKRAGTSAFQFLNIVPGAREASMGGALSHSNNANNIFHNPAGMARIDGVELGLSYNRWISDTTQQTVSGVYPTAYGNFGLGILYLHVGEIKGYDVDVLGDPVRISDFSPYDLLIAGSYSKVFPWFSAGVNVKFFREEIEDVKAEGLAFDFGIRRDFADRLSLGVTVNNAGSGVKFIEEEESLPLSLRVGAAYGITDSLFAAADLLVRNDNTPEAGFGAEYSIIKNLAALRAGYKYANDLSRNFSAGAGITVSGWSLDYAFVPFEDLRDNHRVSLLYRFGKPLEEILREPVDLIDEAVEKVEEKPELPEEPEPYEPEEPEPYEPEEPEPVIIHEEDPVEYEEEEVLIEKPVKESTQVEEGESLWTIAERVYGDPSRWVEIFEANRDIIEDPDLILPGMSLSIPENR